MAVAKGVAEAEESEHTVQALAKGLW